MFHPTRSWVNVDVLCRFHRDTPMALRLCLAWEVEGSSAWPQIASSARHFRAATVSETWAICLHVRRQRWSHESAHSLHVSHPGTPDLTVTCKQVCHSTCRVVRRRLRRFSSRPELKSTSRLSTFASDSSSPACQAQAGGCDAKLPCCLSAQHPLQR